jgi:hypothetical protein
VVSGFSRLAQQLRQFGDVGGDAPYLVPLGCLHFDPNDARRQAWTGTWPGDDDCERLDFFVNGDPDFPDLNRLFTACVWDADTGRWERKQ